MVLKGKRGGLLPGFSYKAVIRRFGFADLDVMISSNVISASTVTYFCTPAGGRNEQTAPEAKEVGLCI